VVRRVLLVDAPDRTFGGYQMNHSPAFLQLVEETKGRIRENHVDDVKRKLDSGERFHLVDVREESEFGRGHLPGAIHLSKGIIERDIEKAIPDKAAPIVLYCGGGFRSALAADNLQKMGYTNVISMDGGWRGWTEAGYSVEGGSGK
jgi:rhodanese-related sulfurtransferase